MSHYSVFRPKPPKNKVNTSDSFELCYLRHQYFRRVKYNPTAQEMQPYMNIVEHLTKNTFFTYFNLFKAVGIYHDDILNIGRVHLVSFLGLYSLENMKKSKKKEWLVKFGINKNREPEEADYEQKNKANFTLFFKQRMEDLVRVCRQKARNIRGQPSEEYLCFTGKNNPIKEVNLIALDPNNLGYKKIDFSIFKSIRKKAGVNLDATFFKFDDLWYIAIPVDQKQLEIEDIIGSGSNPYENEHHKQPDEVFMEKEVDQLSRIFDNKSNYRKKVVLRNFIDKHQKENYYDEEVEIARRALRNLGD